MGLQLYPAQEQAILEVFADRHVILNTPTGSGKTLVATAMQFKAIAENKRAWYTSPIKALVSEKFFALCKDFGAQNVGMLTGDASINRDAPIICCTAEILANAALRNSLGDDVDYVIMDEFHYYGDRDRGMAWQVPLLVLPKTIFLLMSATLGDLTPVVNSLKELTGREVAEVRSNDRPVPLDFEYRETTMTGTISGLIEAERAPIYIVNFTQREAGEQAQDLLSVDFCSKQEKAALAEATQGFRFDTPFGKTISRLVKHGVGIHHAGLLPKYRRLVERLAQQGLLKIVSGTDTLGVGVNIPIRTVLFAKLCKFDGAKVGILRVREFRQISGRAGRKGFDDRGTVVCQAPEHVALNKRLAEKADKAEGKKKFVKKQPPQKNFVPWNKATFQELRTRPVEPLESVFEVTHGVMLNLLQGDPGRNPGGYGRLVQLIARSHESVGHKTRHRRHAAQLFRSLRQAGIVSVVVNRREGGRVVINEDLQRDFSLHHTLSLYLMDALPQLDRQSPTYGLDVLTLVESILENPDTVLYKQIDKLKTAKMAELKAQGVEFDERIRELDTIEHPKPLAEFVYETFNAFARKHPWVKTENIRPKSVARDLYERCMSFQEYVREYGIERSEGLLLRYLGDAYKTLVQNVPEAVKDELTLEIQVYLRTVLGHVDSSLVSEWEELRTPQPAGEEPVPARARLPFDPEANPRVFAARVRAELHQLVKALAVKDYEQAAELVRQRPEDLWTAERFATALQPYLSEYGGLVFSPRARQSEWTQLKRVAQGSYEVQQVLLDPNDDNQWCIGGRIEFDEDLDPEQPLVAIDRIGI